ncbi:hypothetical protein C4561_01740 [candidate division WWE3 bacterium]|uniref:Uncharacterized protein n=1 Tax=candidate division WWE3 bacterium TaxID=2053526 RepID=A0A3A4ZEQ5_UNCKA|nr:MAG: hypothetical protein C4561_01740 [candidate division WWE3 bacterium]
MSGGASRMLNEESSKRSDKSELRVEVHENLLLFEFELEGQQHRLDFHPLLTLNGVNVELVPDVTLNDYLSYISSVRFTLDGFICRFEMEINKVKLDFEAWLVSAREVARTKLVEQSLKLVQEGAVAKSFVTEPSREKINDQAFVSNVEIYKSFSLRISELEVYKNAFERLLFSVQQASICFLNVLNRRHKNL